LTDGCVVLAQSAGSPAEFKFQRVVDDFVQVQTKFSFSHVLPVPISSLALSLNKQILVFVIIVYYYCCLLICVVCFVSRSYCRMWYYWLLVWYCHLSVCPCVHLSV